MNAHGTQFDNLVAGNDEQAAVHRKFYDEYLAVMDLDAAFYLQTIKKIFQDHELPRGVLEYRGHRIDLAAIRRTAMLTVEGELDDICAIGQTMAAPRPVRRRAAVHEAPTICRPASAITACSTGRRWAGEIYPRVREIIQSTTR